MIKQKVMIVYNDLDMLTSETKLDSTNGVIYEKTYQYDLAGNRTNTVIDGVTNIYTLGTGNKLSSWGTNGSMQYADAGNVTNIIYNDGRSIALAWNDRYEITSITTNGALAESYEYDALGRRVSISDGTTTNYLIYDGIHVIAEVGTSSLLVRSYSYGPGIDNILAMTDHSVTQTYFFVKDHLGSVVAITDETGTNIVERYEYDAWGNTSVFDGSGNPLTESAIGNRYCWQGREISWKTGLYYFRARWYDPVTGRWLSKDPIGISGGLNQYVFCGNNPVNARDPLGLCEEDIEQIEKEFNNFVKWLVKEGHRPEGGNRNVWLWYWDCTKQAKELVKYMEQNVIPTLNGNWIATWTGHNLRRRVNGQFQRSGQHHWVIMMDNSNARVPTLLLDPWTGKSYRIPGSSDIPVDLYGTQPTFGDNWPFVWPPRRLQSY